MADAVFAEYKNYYCEGADTGAVENHYADDVEDDNNYGKTGNYYYADDEDVDDIPDEFHS